jgi:protocatechuate 3,4-dioxygenase beta subunit
MTRTCSTLLAALLIAPFAFAQQPGQPSAPNANTPPPPPGTSILRGHVTGAETGKPLRRAQVRITAGEIRENRLTTTDENGTFEFTEVRAGRYNIEASKGGYVAAAFGQQRPTDVGRPLQILDNQTVERLDFALAPGCIVTGRIVDEYGEPMSRVTIAAQRYVFAQGQRRLVSTGRSVSTDDLGEFRLFGVPPGQYYLTATWRHIDAGQVSEDRTAYGTMFFPGTDSPSEAKRYTLVSGQQIDNLVMAMRPTKAAKVTGTATKSDGSPMTGMLMAVQQTSGTSFMMNNGGQIHPDGTFSTNPLAPGDYTLVVQQAGPNRPDTESARFKVTLSGEDLNDIHLVGVKPSTISGRLLVDPAAGQPPSSNVMAMPVDPGEMFAGVTSARPNDDGTFELLSRPGRFRITLVNTPAGWALRSVRLNGVDVTDTGVDVKPAEDISGLEVELTNKATTISGLVTNARGEAVQDYTAIVFSQDRANWTGNTRYQGISRPDQDGRFKINLPPGEYYIVAVDRVEQGQSGDPDFLESIRPKATPFSVMEGETKTMDLKVTSPQ